METLQATKHKIQVKATTDTTWGTGVLLTNSKALDKNEWKNCGMDEWHTWIIRDNN